MPKTTAKYPGVYVEVRSKSTVFVPKKKNTGAVTVDEAKEIIGWTEEPADEKWDKEFTLKDLYGKKVRLVNNPTNRPFRRPLADRYASEHLRGKWSLNLETIVIDANGFVLQGQHRLVSLILGEQTRQINPSQWGSTPLVLEVAIGYGVSPKPENANTYDLGASRSLGDVIYRHQQFGKKITEKEQKKIAKLLSGAIRLVWLRVGGKQVSFAPHFPHSEALEFYKKHPKTLNSVKEILKLDAGEEGNERLISSLLSLSYAAALYYLQSSVNADKALKFWTLFASGEGLEKGDPILVLRQSLSRFDTSSGSSRDALIGMVVNAWNLWSKGKKATTKEIKVARKKDGDRFILAEFPRIGGLDSDAEVEDQLTQHQLVLVSVLKKSRKELTYAQLTERTGLQAGTIGKAILDRNGEEEVNPQSLMARGLVTAKQYEPQEGEKGSPYMFGLTKTGRSS